MPTSVPIHASEVLAKEWIASAQLDPEAVKPRQSPVFSEQSFQPGEGELTDLWSTGAHISWLGGPAALTGDWPRNAQAEPLAHVATVHCADAHAALGNAYERAWPADAAELLPDDGYLQIFHDLQTYGYEASDAASSSWAILYTPEDPVEGRPPLVAQPGESVAPNEVTQPGLFLPGWSIPSPLDVDVLAPSTFDAADQAYAQLQSAWLRQRRPQDRKHHSFPSTRMLGHSSSGDLLPTQEVLPQVLPLSVPGDEYVLLIEVESWTTLSGWFGDASSLEVWMRRSDVLERRFDAAWCMIRTD